MPTDLRPSISEQAKAQLAEALKAIPDGRRGALVVIADDTGARAHVAAKIGGHWKVAASGGTTWHGAVTGTVAVEGSW